MFRLTVFTSDDAQAKINQTISLLSLPKFCLFYLTIILQYNPVTEHTHNIKINTLLYNVWLSTQNLYTNSHNFILKVVTKQPSTRNLPNSTNLLCYKHYNHFKVGINFALLLLLIDRLVTKRFLCNGH